MPATGEDRDPRPCEDQRACRLCQAPAGSRCVVVAGPRAGQVTTLYPHWVREEDHRGAGREWAAEQALMMSRGGLASAEVKGRGGPYRGRHLRDRATSGRR